MKKTILFFLFLFNFIFPFACGNIELPQESIKLDKIELSIDKKHFSITLPYNKPEGVNKIITAAHTAILIDKIIGDGKLIKPRKNFQWMAADDTFVNGVITEDVDIRNMDFFIRMNWRPYGSKIEDGMSFLTYIMGHRKRYSRYTIPYNVKEIYITYRIIFPPRGSGVLDMPILFSDLKIEETSEMRTVYFEIDWSSVN